MKKGEVMKKRNAMIVTISVTVLTLVLLFGNAFFVLKISTLKTEIQEMQKDLVWKNDQIQRLELEMRDVRFVTSETPILELSVIDKEISFMEKKDYFVSGPFDTYLWPMFKRAIKKGSSLKDIQKRVNKIYEIGNSKQSGYAYNLINDEEIHQAFRKLILEAEAMDRIQSLDVY